jgi:hypothetical protein
LIKDTLKLGFNDGSAELDNAKMAVEKFVSLEEKVCGGKDVEENDYPYFGFQYQFAYQRWVRPFQKLERTAEPQEHLAMSCLGEMNAALVTIDQLIPNFRSARSLRAHTIFLLGLHQLRSGEIHDAISVIDRSAEAFLSAIDAGLIYGETLISCAGDIERAVYTLRSDGSDASNAVVTHLCDQWLTLLHKFASINIVHQDWIASYCYLMYIRLRAEGESKRKSWRDEQRRIIIGLALRVIAEQPSNSKIVRIVAPVLKEDPSWQTDADELIETSFSVLAEDGLEVLSVKR